MVKLIGWRSGAALLAAATLSVWGCSADSNDEAGPVESNAGQGGEASVGGDGGASGAPDAAGAGGTAGAACGTEAICAGADCPTLDTLPVSCGQGWAWKIQATTCSGTLVTAISAGNTTRYCFDDQGSLVGRVSLTDVPAKRVVEGTDCTAAGTAEDMCERDSCDPLPLDELCEQHPAACPENADALRANGQCPGSVVKRYASSCDGTVISNDSDRFFANSWSFDADGKLTGYVVTGDLDNECSDGTFSFTQPFGETCEKLGTGEAFCETVSGGEGGAGGDSGVGGDSGRGGAAGAGGAP